MSEEDGGADAPEEVRRAIIAQGGLWALHVELGDGPKDRVNAASALRAELGLSVAEIAELKARLPCEVTRGTQVEMDHLRLRLAQRHVTSRLVLIEPGTAPAPEPVETPLCQGCKQWPEGSACSRCGARVCQACRRTTHCARCAFEVVREVLAGKRVGGRFAEAKMLRILLGEGDIHVDTRGIDCRRPYERQHPTRELFAELAPFVVGELLDRAGIARLDAPTVAAVRKRPLPRFGDCAEVVDLCAWFIPEPHALRILLRKQPDLPPAPQSIPAEGPFALPPPLPAYVRPTPKLKFHEETSPRACPHCGKMETRFRDADGWLVCPSCGRSFQA